VLMVGASAG